MLPRCLKQGKRQKPYAVAFNERLQVSRQIPRGVPAEIAECRVQTSDLFVNSEVCTLQSEISRETGSLASVSLLMRSDSITGGNGERQLIFRGRSGHE